MRRSHVSYGRGSKDNDAVRRDHDCRGGCKSVHRGTGGFHASPIAGDPRINPAPASGPVGGGVVTYMVAGRQYVAVASGMTNSIIRARQSVGQSIEQLAASQYGGSHVNVSCRHVSRPASAERGSCAPRAGPATVYGLTKQDAHQVESQARVATISASTPVSRVGWMTGRKRGLWLVGISLSRPAALAFA